MAALSVNITGDIQDIANLEKVTTTKTNIFASKLADILRENVKSAIIDTDALASRNMFRSISVQIIEQFNQFIEIQVGSDVPYAEFAEEGRPSGKQPPVDVIMKWMLDKGIDSPYGLESGAYLIARKIGREGSKGKHPFAIALERTERQISSIAERVFS